MAIILLIVTRSTGNNFIWCDFTGLCLESRLCGEWQPPAYPHSGIILIVQRRIAWRLTAMRGQPERR
jgi:hypothetical protein